LRGTRGGMALHSDVKTAVVLSTASATGPKPSPVRSTPCSGSAKTGEQLISRHARRANKT
jgi:hypothetical protein